MRATITDKYGNEYIANVPAGAVVGEFECAKNGYKYNGEFQGDKMTGHGVWHVTGGDRYEGQWLNGMKHGYGTYFYKSGAVYQGQYDYHKAQGKARLTRGRDVRDYIWVDNNESASVCDMANILPLVIEGAYRFRIFKSTSSLLCNLIKRIQLRERPKKPKCALRME